MSRNYYSELNFHVVWHTKESAPLLTTEVEPFAHRVLKQRVINEPGAFIHEVGGTENHVHLVLTLPPTILLSDFIGQLKGASAHEANVILGRGNKLLQWQAGYGVVTFGTRDLDWVKLYVRNQRQHHAKSTIHDRLERITQIETPVVTPP